MTYFKIITCSAVIIFLDQLSKFFFLQNPAFLKNGSFFELYLTMNQAIAFSLPLPQILIFILILSILIGGGFYAHRNFKLDYWLTQFSLGLILGGALGNLLDRIRLGEVVDFIKIGPWPMFNLADSAVCVGAVVIVVWYQDITLSAKN